MRGVAAARGHGAEGPRAAEGPFPNPNGGAAAGQGSRIRDAARRSGCRVVMWEPATVASGAEQGAAGGGADPWRPRGRKDATRRCR